MQKLTLENLRKRESEFAELEDRNSVLLQEVTIMKQEVQEKQHMIET